jgi:Fur family peroxide stress response transcriptional regulator
MGDLQEVTIDPERKHYDPNLNPHHHIVCTRCNRIGDVFKDYSKVLYLSEDILKVFKVTGNHVDFYGVCVECQENKKQKEA